MDILKLEDTIDGINETLIRYYSRPPGCCKKVKTAILDRARVKGTLPVLVLTYKDVQEIGKELIHESLYDYVTYLNRKTLNDVLYRLMQKGLIESPYFNVPQQKYRKVYTTFDRVKYEELLLIEALDRELRTFDIDNPDLPVRARLSKDADLVCRIIASSAIHGAMLFKGFHEQLLSLSLENIDLMHGFLTVKLHQSEDIGEDYSPAFFRYFISPITMVYILNYVSLYRKELKIGRPRLKNKTAGSILFGDHWREEAGNVSSLFRQWTETIARKFDLPSGMDIERFRYVTVRYLPLKYPIFLLSIHSRALLSDSLAPYHFSPLLNMKTSIVSDNFRSLAKSGKGSNETLREIIGNDGPLAKAVLEIISLRGSMKDKADKKATAERIRLEAQTITKAVAQDSGELPPVLGNYRIYWDWLLYLIESTRLSPGSISTYTGSIGRHFIPLLSEKNMLTSGKEYIETRILECIKRYETNSLIKDLRRFFSFIKLQHPGVELPGLSQKKFRKAVRSVSKPLLYFEDVRKVIAAVPDVQLRLIIILGFYAGLRAGEIVNLKLGNIIYDGGYVLCVRKSKTKNGARNIPLYLLMPDDHLMELITYWKTEMAGRRPEDFLFMKKGRRLDSKDTSPIIERLFEQISGIVMEFHHLRHSFSCWFLIRWFAAIYGKDLFDPDCQFLREEVFGADCLERLKLLLFGFRVLKKGQDSFSHVFAALARLVGHGSPRITIRHYIHVTDFLMHLYLRKKHSGYKAGLTKKTLAKLLNVSHVTMPRYFGGSPSRPLTVQDIVDAQKTRLGLADNI